MENETGPPDAHSLKALKYLTVQDVLWINLVATKKVQHFNFARLEEATFYQYGYGASRNIALQAGRFLSGLMKLRPFDAGNEPTAFIGCVAFLLLNGFSLNVRDSDAFDWVQNVRVGTLKVEEEIGNLAVPDEASHDHIVSNVKDSVQEVMRRYPETLIRLGDFAPEQMAS
jgi:prophage maintenance system killer protein